MKQPWSSFIFLIVILRSMQDPKNGTRNGFVRDITDNQNLQRCLLEAVRLLSLGDSKKIVFFRRFFFRKIPICKHFGQIFTDGNLYFLGI